MPSNLKGKTIAILATDGFEQSELIKPKQALEDAGVRLHRGLLCKPTFETRAARGWIRK
jgi:hypothetical protein